MLARLIFLFMFVSPFAFMAIAAAYAGEVGVAIVVGWLALFIGWISNMAFDEA